MTKNINKEENTFIYNDLKKKDKNFLINEKYKFLHFYFYINNLYRQYLIIKKKFPLLITKIIIAFFLLFEYTKLKRKKINNNNKGNNINIFIKKNINKPKYIFKNAQFAIIQKKCTKCGLFSFYIYFLGCLNKYLNKGYIPVIDLKSYPNAYNNYSNTSIINPWEFLFEQPFGFTLEDTLRNAKKINIFECGENFNRPDERKIYYNKELINFWHDTSKKYIPIKKEIIDETNIIIKKLFFNSNNVLGVKLRGTDYITMKLKNHPIPPKLDDVISDVKKLIEKNKYDWVFIASEDERIKKRFINTFIDKIKYLNSKNKINYDYNKKEIIIKNKNVAGNLEYAKNYLMNIYILTKCTDIVMTRGSGGAGVIILTEGFRNSLIYNLGDYKI